MRYCGSKRRFMKELKPILMEHLKDEDTLFVDAFSGGMNVVSEIPHVNKWAVDYDKYVIALWKHIQEKGSAFCGLPCSLTEEEYNDIHNSEVNNDGRYPDWLIGYVSTACSYGGGVWKGYAKYNHKKNEDHINEAFNGLVKQVNNFKYLRNTAFINCSYDELSYPPKSVIYCDPPYAETVSYRSSFNHEKFWEWVRKMSKKGHYVYVSEYTAPDNFKCIWEKKKKDGMGTTKKGVKQNVKTEKLFVYNGK